MNRKLKELQSLIDQLKQQMNIIASIGIGSTKEIEDALKELRNAQDRLRHAEEKPFHVPPGSKIAIVGDPDYPDVEAVAQFVRCLPKDITVVSGQRGAVEETVIKMAKSCGIPAEVFLENTDLGKHANKQRSLDIVTSISEGTSCSVVLFRNINSSLKKFDVASIALSVGIDVHTVYPRVE